MADTTAAQLAELDFATVSPQEFARLVKGLSTKEIRELMRGDLRLAVLRAVFDRMERQFRADNAGQTTALVRWKVGEPGGDDALVFETAIENGGCQVTEGRSEATPRVTLSLGDAEFLTLVSGNASPVTMFFSRKLKVAGDLSLAARLTHYFDIPKA